MAVMKAEIDTTTKDMTISVNGVEVPFAESFNLYVYRDSNGTVTGFDVSLDASIKNDDDNVRVRISYYSFGSEKANKALASGSVVYKDIDGFIGVGADQHKVEEDIDNYLSSKKSPFA